MENSLIRKLDYYFEKADITIPPGDITNSTNSSDIIYTILADKMDMVESFVVVYLNNSSTPIGYSVLFTGGITACNVDVRVVFATALSCMATSIIVGHNHPSGNLTPSNPDKRLTSQIQDAGKLLNIKLLDHIIVTPTKGQYYSFADENLI